MDNYKSVERKYGKITFNQANQDLKQIMVAKGGQTADVSAGSYGTVFREMLAAHSDVLGFWTESSFNNGWLETATTREAGFVGGRFLGYSVRRPVPARAGFNVKLKRTGNYSTVKVVVPKGTTFSVASNTMTAIDDVEMLYDRNDPDFETGILKILSGRAILCEGTFKSATYFSDGSQFQEFLLLDASMSNWFGDCDPNFIEPDSMSDRVGRFMTVTTDSGLVNNIALVPGHEEKVFWRIDRRGLVDPSLKSTINDLVLYSNDGNSTLNYTCLVTTTNDGLVKVEFGDGVISAIPYGMITVNYFSTKGVGGNVVNIAGTKMTPSGTDILIVQADGRESDLTLSDLTFALTTDITGGLNIESLESIKKNAPSVFNSLDSLGNRATYTRYLSNVSDVKYAIAFGEDILSRYSGNGADIKYANIVRFSVLKDLYRERDGKFYVTDPFEYYVKGYKVNGLMNLWDYDYRQLPNQTYLDEQDRSIDEMRKRMETDGAVVLVNGSQMSISDFISAYLPKLSTSYEPINKFSTGLKPLDMVETGSELYLIMENLNRRGYVTLGNGQHSYVPPTVHDMGVSIDLILHEGANFSDIKTNVTNRVYAFLRDNTRFASPVYRSAIESLIQQLPETAGVNVSFSAITNGYENLELDKLQWMSYATKKFVNQEGLEPETMQVTFEYDVKYKLTNGSYSSPEDASTAIMIGNQDTIRTQIRNYYTSKIAYITKDGTYAIKNNLTEKDLTDFVSYIWSISINELYAPVYSMYKYHGNRGELKDKVRMFNLLNTLKTWTFKDGVVGFLDCDVIQNLKDTSGVLFKYIVYTIEYIKLVRNIVNPSVAAQLIDADGNVTKFSNSHEIVQFRISPSDFKVRFGAEGYKG